MHLKIITIKIPGFVCVIYYAYFGTLYIHICMALCFTNTLELRLMTVKCIFIEI